MGKVAVVLIGSSGLNIGECYRENYGRKVPFILLESHKTLYQAERGAELIGHKMLEPDVGTVSREAHEVSSAADISESYYKNVPNYLQGELGSLLFFTTAEQQFASKTMEESLDRAQFYEQEIVAALAGYEHLIVVACLGGAANTAIAPYVARLAKQQHMDVSTIVTMPAMFEGKKRRQQADKGLVALHKFSNVTLLETDQEDESMIEYFKMKDLAIVESIEKTIIKCYEV